MYLAHIKILLLSNLQPILNIRPTLSTRLTVNVISTLYLAKSLISSETKRLRLSTFIFYVMMVILEHVNLILPDSAGVYQSCTIK